MSFPFFPPFPIKAASSAKSLRAQVFLEVFPGADHLGESFSQRSLFFWKTSFPHNKSKKMLFLLSWLHVFSLITTPSYTILQGKSEG